MVAVQTEVRAALDVEARVVYPIKVADRMEFLTLNVTHISEWFRRIFFLFNYHGRALVAP